MGSRTRSSPSTPGMSKSMLSVGGSPGGGESMTLTNQQSASYFPYRLTATLAALKVVSGCLLVGLGAAAMVQQAGYSRQATGIWTGVVVIISGVLGAWTIRTGALRGSVIGFLLSSVLSLISSVVVIIYSATGLARDANQPYGLRRDEQGNLVVWEEGVMVPNREAAMLINTLLIIMGVLDVIFSLPSIIISLREVCQCYNPSLLLPPPVAPPPRKDLMTWLGQQPTGVFYSPSSGIPYHPMPPMAPFPRANPPYMHLPSEPSTRPSPHSRDERRRSRAASRGGGEDQDRRREEKGEKEERKRQRSKSPGVHHHHSVHPQPNLFYPPMELYAPFYPTYPSPSSLPPYYGPPPWLYEWDPQHRDDQQRLHRKEERRKAKERELRKRSRSKSTGPRETSGGHKSKRQKGPTDSDIEKSYTGMDRDLAEEFIEQTMDPAILIDQTMSGTESEAW